MAIKFSSLLSFLFIFAPYSSWAQDLLCEVHASSQGLQSNGNINYDVLISRKRISTENELEGLDFFMDQKSQTRYSIIKNQLNGKLNFVIEQLHPQNQDSQKSTFHGFIPIANIVFERVVGFRYYDRERGLAFSCKIQKLKMASTYDQRLFKFR